MTTWILQFAFGDWNNYSVPFTMLLIAIWLVAAIIKLSQMVRGETKKVRVLEMPLPPYSEDESRFNTAA